MPEPTLFSGTIVEVNVVKSGNTNGRDWTIFEVHAIPEGEIAPKKFSTFEKKWREKVGQKVAFFFEEVQRGKFTNLQITGDPEKQARRQKRATNDRARVEVLEKLDGLERKLDAALDWIRENGQRLGGGS